MKFYTDVETRSPVDLKKAGMYRYFEEAEIQVLAYARDDEPVRSTTDPQEMRDIIQEAYNDPSVSFVCHNAAFERVAFSGLLGLPVGEYLPPERFEDTMILGAMAGLPLSLSALAREVAEEQKDEAGTSLIRWFAVPTKDGTFRDPAGNPEKFAEYVRYCEQDVETTRDIYLRIPNFMSDMEKHVLDASERINDRGVEIDREFAEAAVKASEANKARDLTRMKEIMGVENPNSTAQLVGWVQTKVPDFPDAKKATVDEYLERKDLPEDVREVLTLRQSTALAASAKYKAALEGLNSDGRLRGTLRPHGAATGRWSGRQMQLQNLPSAKAGEDHEVEAQVLDVKLGLDVTQDELKSLVRPSIMGPLCVSDFSAIEARVIAWLAGEEKVLESFREGKDIYVTTAAGMYDVSYEDAFEYRKQGKIAVLACGFGGGAKALKAFGAPGSDEDLWDMVNRYRDANPKIRQFWRDLEKAFVLGGTAGRITFEKDGSDRHMILPSGRRIVYRGCKKRMTDDGRIKYTHRDHRRGGAPVSIYAGILANNSTQGTARDIMAEALVRLDGEGYQVVSTVHDEVLVQAPESELDNVVRLMTTPPEWSEGLPIEADGYYCARYVKR